MSPISKAKKTPAKRPVPKRLAAPAPHSKPKVGAKPAAKSHAKPPAKASTKPVPKSAARPVAKGKSSSSPAPEAPSAAPPRTGDARRHVLSLSFLRDGDEFLARLETDGGQITELKNRALDQLLTLVAGELEDLLE
ncbi:MAG: hypothetical protein L3J91_00410 [Thermoplasmata archaeon]|nr:hypothetical protein [Thermoplasmata archaeon]